jgi:hypothetical protein
MTRATVEAVEVAVAKIAVDADVVGAIRARV